MGDQQDLDDLHDQDVRKEEEEEEEWRRDKCRDIRRMEAAVACRDFRRADVRPEARNDGRRARGRRRVRRRRASDASPDDPRRRKWAPGGDGQ